MASVDRQSGVSIQHERVTAAHVVRQFQRAKAETASLVCQLHVMPFDLESAIIDINETLDIATFAISEPDLRASRSEAFDVSAHRPPQDGVVK